MSVFETLAAVFLALGVMALIVFLRIRENRYLKKTSKEALPKKLFDELEEEKSEILRKKEKFEETLKSFSGQ